MMPHFPRLKQAIETPTLIIVFKKVTSVLQVKIMDFCQRLRNK